MEKQQEDAVTHEATIFTMGGKMGAEAHPLPRSPSPFRKRGNNPTVAVIQMRIQGMQY